MTAQLRLAGILRRHGLAEGSTLRPARGSSATAHALGREFERGGIAEGWPGGLLTASAPRWWTCPTARRAVGAGHGVVPGAERGCRGDRAAWRPGRAFWSDRASKRRLGGAQCDRARNRHHVSNIQHRPIVPGNSREPQCSFPMAVFSPVAARRGTQRRCTTTSISDMRYITQRSAAHARPGCGPRLPAGDRTEWRDIFTSAHAAWGDHFDNRSVARTVPPFTMKLNSVLPPSEPAKHWDGS